MGLELSDRAGMELESRILSRSIVIVFSYCIHSTEVKEIVPGEYEEKKEKFRLKVKEIT